MTRERRPDPLLPGEKPIRFSIPVFDGLDVYGKEEAWVRRFLAEPGVPALLGRLLRFEGPFARRQLVLRPGALNVTFHLSTAFTSWIPSPAQVRDWADALVALARIAESVPPQGVPIAPTRLEQQVDSVRRMGFAVDPGALAIGTMLATSLVIAAIAGIIIVAQRSCRPSRGPGSVAEAREVEWIFELPLPAGTSVVEQQLGKLELSPVPGEPEAVLGLATPRQADGARWPVRVRVRFEGKAGGPITRIAVVRDGPAAPLASTPSGLLPQCPISFEDVGEMAIGESRSCVCTDMTGLNIFGSGRTSPSSDLCVAARHAGVLSRPGDVVTFWRQPDCPRLWGSAANDVVSKNGASPTAAFSFTAEPPPCPPPPSTSADLKPCPGLFSRELEAMPEGSSFECTCAYDRYGRGALWGTRVYFLGSDVCDAAQHAGMVHWKGSTVTVFLGGECGRFRRSKSFGKVSESRQKPGRSMAFQQPYPECPGPTDPW